MTSSGDGAGVVVVDTNVLLAATDRSRTSHDAAAEFLRNDERRLAISPQIAREYLVVATRPVEVNGLGLEVQAAAGNLRQFLLQLELLAESQSSTHRLLDLTTRHAVAGKQIHDANVVAVALANGAVSIVTDNPRHFTRFGELIAIECLAASEKP